MTPKPTPTAASVPRRISWRSMASGWLYALLVASVTSFIPSFGCVAPARRLVAPNREYALYRRVRLSRELLPRLAAANQYLTEYPNGVWANEVRPWFQRAELRYYLHNKHSIHGLEAYLHHLPAGPHSVEALGHLEDLKAHTRDAIAAKLAKRAAATEAELARLQRQREAARDEFFAWLSRLLELDSWNQPTSNLSPDFILWWRLAKPPARCVDDLCTKNVYTAYALPGNSTKGARQLVMDVVLNLDHDRVQRAIITGPALFSRLYEIYDKRAVNLSDTDARMSAIEFAIDLTSSAARTAWSRFAPCVSAPVSSPVVLDLQCKSRRLQLQVATDSQPDDKIIITPTRH